MPLEASPAHNPEEKRSAFQKPKGEVVEKPDEPKEKKTEKDEKDEKENINPKESEISPEIPSSGLYDDFTDSDKARGWNNKISYLFNQKCFNFFRYYPAASSIIFYPFPANMFFLRKFMKSQRLLLDPSRSSWREILPKETNGEEVEGKKVTR